MPDNHDATDGTDANKATDATEATEANKATDATVVPESRDGVGSADHDQPYTFGNRPSSNAPSPFTFREYLRLQMLRGRFEDPNWPMVRDVREPRAA